MFSNRDDYGRRMEADFCHNCHKRPALCIAEGGTLWLCGRCSVKYVDAHPVDADISVSEITPNIFNEKELQYESH